MSASSISLTHLVQTPSELSPGLPPLLVLLHGVGSNEEDLMGLAPYLDPRFFIVSVRAPITLGHWAYGWFSLQLTSGGMVHDPEEAERGRQAVEQVIDELVAAYDVDPERIYLAGFSQGAIMSLATLLKDPKKVAGAVIMSGCLLPELIDKPVDTAALEGFPILIVHGANDGVLPIAMGRQIRDYLSNLPVSLTYHEYPMGHQVNQQSLDDIAAWLKAQIDGE